MHVVLFVLLGVFFIWGMVATMFYQTHAEFTGNMFASGVLFIVLLAFMLFLPGAFSAFGYEDAVITANAWTLVLWAMSYVGIGLAYAVLVEAPLYVFKVWRDVRAEWKKRVGTLKLDTLPPLDLSAFTSRFLSYAEPDLTRQRGADFLRLAHNTTTNRPEMRVDKSNLIDCITVWTLYFPAFIFLLFIHRFVSAAVNFVTKVLLASIRRIVSGIFDRIFS